MQTHPQCIARAKHPLVISALQANKMAIAAPVVLAGLMMLTMCHIPCINLTLKGSYTMPIFIREFIGFGLFTVLILHLPQIIQTLGRLM